MPKALAKKAVNLDVILALRPCMRAREDYQEQMERGYDSWIEALKDESVAIRDRIWIGIRALPTDKARMLFACWCAEQALDQVHPSKVDDRSINAIAVAKRYANSKATLRELQEAAYAANAAAAYADANAAANAADAAYAAANAAANAANAAANAANAAAAAYADDAAYAAANAANAAANAAYAAAAANAAAAAYADDAAAARQKMYRKEIARLIKLHREAQK